MESFENFEAVEVAQLLAIDAGYLIDNRVVIVGCTQPKPPLGPGQVTWNPWIGQPYPMPY